MLNASQVVFSQWYLFLKHLTQAAENPIPSRARDDKAPKATGILKSLKKCPDYFLHLCCN
jgi:hypothetical protein